MKKYISILVLALFAICLTGCSTFKSYTYEVSTGDKIEVKLKTNDKYDLTSDMPITFTKDGKEVGQGLFYKEEAYDIYYNAMKEAKADILKEEKNKYFFYKYDAGDHVEYNYIIKIEGSNTVFIIATINEQEDAEKLFDRLEFSMVK